MATEVVRRNSTTQDSDDPVGSVGNHSTSVLLLRMSSRNERADSWSPLKTSFSRAARTPTSLVRAGLTDEGDVLLHHSAACFACAGRSAGNSSGVIVSLSRRSLVPASEVAPATV